MPKEIAVAVQPHLARMPHVVCGFLADLQDHNDTAWFSHNRARYHNEVVLPLKAFFACLAPMLAIVDDRLDTDYRVNTTVMRINRDRRFQPGAPPYRTFVKMAWPHRGHRWSTFPVLGFAITAHGFHATFRNADATQRGPYIARYAHNLGRHPGLVQAWLDRYRIPAALHRLDGTHHEVTAQAPCFARAEQWQADMQPTIGTLWARRACVAGGPLIVDIARTLVLLYFLDLMAIEDRPVAAARAYFRRADALLAT